MPTLLVYDFVEAEYCDCGFNPNTHIYDSTTTAFVSSQFLYVCVCALMMSVCTSACARVCKCAHACVCAREGERELV